MNVRWVIVSVLLVALLTGCATNTPVSGLYVELGGSVTSQEKIAFPELAHGADQIVVGQIVSVASAWNADQTQIFTTAKLRVSEAVKGSNPGTILLRVEGGQVGYIAQAVSGGLFFKPGDQVVLFLKGPSVFGGLQGLYPVESGNVGEQSLAAFLEQVRAGQ